MLKNQSIKQSVRRAIERRLPILQWLPKYSLEDAASDLVAGITVGLTLMPQAIAYAALAGLPSQYGLYSAFAGSFVYIIFGSCKEVNIGPTALLSLLTASYTQGTHPDMAVLLCFLSGCVELLCGVFQLDEERRDKERFRRAAGELTSSRVLHFSYNNLDPGIQ